MEVKQRGTAFGYKILLFIYELFGYRFVAFILNFVVLYYVFFAFGVKKSMKSYYQNQAIKLTVRSYFKHIRNFSLAIFDRFVSRIKPEDLSFVTFNEDAIRELNHGGIVLLSHVGSWASAAHCLQGQLPSMNIVMRENTQENIYKVEEKNKRHNEYSVKIIDLNNGAIAANIQIANALIKKELIALMVDRVVDPRQIVDVDFFNKKVQINKNPFDIAIRMNKPVVSIFVMNTDVKQYNIYLNLIKSSNITNMAQEYMNILESMMKEYPDQWYNFYDFFEQAI